MTLLHNILRILKKFRRIYFSPEIIVKHKVDQEFLIWSQKIYTNTGDSEPRTHSLVSICMAFQAIKQSYFIKDNNSDPDDNEYIIDRFRIDT